MPGHDDPVHDVPVKDLKNGLRNLCAHVIVLEISPRTAPNKEGVEMRTCKVADRTACINLSVPDQEIGAHLTPGDICKVTKCFVSNHEGPLTLYIEPTTPTSAPSGQAPQSAPTSMTPAPVSGNNNLAASTTSAV